MNHRKLAFGTMTLMAVNVVKSVALFLLLPVMAKLVGPAEYGVYSIALPAVMFVMVIADGGLGISLARERDDNSMVWSTAFYALVAAALCLAGLLIGYSWLVASGAGGNKLLLVTAALSSSLIFSALSVVPSARLVRDGEMPTLAMIDMTSFVIGASGSLMMAMMGYGVWSLVAQIVLISLIRALLVNLRSPTRLRFGLDLPSLRPHVALGGAVGLARLSDFGGRMGEMYIVNGTAHGAMTGAFGFGNQVGKFACELVNNQIWALMYIIGLNAGKDELRLYYFRLTRVIAMLVLPIAALTSASAHELIALTMGAEWAPSAALVAAYTPAFAIVCIASIGSSLMYARGIAGPPLLLNIQLVVLRIIAICALPLYGWSAMVIALAIGHVFNAAHAFWVIERKYEWGIGSLLLWLLKPGLAATGAGFVLSYLLRTLPLSVGSVAAGGLVGGLVYVCLLLAMDFKQIRADLSDFYALLRNRKKSDQAAGEQRS